MKGNDRQFSILSSWINDFLHNKQTQKYHILTSDYNGNGLTLLSKELAHAYNLEFTEITSLDIVVKDNLKRVQGLMLSSNFKGQRRLIVFDEITEIKYKKDIFKLVEVSKNPVIFTTTSVYKLPKQYRNNIIRIYKPSLTDMISILKEKAKKYELSISNSEILEIINSSPSVATAINALFSKYSSDITGTSSYYSTYYNFIKDRRVSIDNIFLYWLVDNIVDMNDNRFIDYLQNVYSLIDMNGAITIEQNEIKGSVMFSNQPSYPIYFQYKAGALSHYNNLSIFLSKLGGILHLSKKEVINDILPILRKNAKDNEWLLSQIKELGLSKEEIRMLGIKYIRKKTKKVLNETKHKKEISLSGYF